jgi:hypothetical protein
MHTGGRGGEKWDPLNNLRPCLSSVESNPLIINVSLRVSQSLMKAA